MKAAAASAILFIHLPVLGFSDIQCSTVRLLFAHQYFNERGLSRTIVSHDAHLLITGKDHYGLSIR